MKVAVYSQYPKKQSEEALIKLNEVLQEKKASLFLEEEFYNDIKAKLNTTYKTFTALNSSFDLLISIGGDGTILRAITFVKDLNIPIIGINTGRLGFLATIQTEGIAEAIDNIYKKKLFII